MMSKKDLPLSCAEILMNWSILLTLLDDQFYGFVVVLQKLYFKGI